MGDITDCLYIIAIENLFICDLYTNDNNMLLEVKSNLMLRFIGVTLDYLLINMEMPLYMHPYMNVSVRILDLSINLNIKNLVIVMKPFCGKSNSLFQMRD